MKILLVEDRDVNTIHQILIVGGNDWIGKTLAPSELIPKIFHHLDRAQYGGFVGN